MEGNRLNQKQIIVEKLSERIREQLMKAVEKMPDEFDGWEIAQYLEDHVKNDISNNKEFKKKRYRYREYRFWYLNNVIVKN